MEETTLFDDIRAVRDACRVILGDDELLRSPTLLVSSVGHCCVASYACNSVQGSSVDRMDLSVNIGTHAMPDGCELSVADHGVPVEYEDEMINDKLDNQFFDIDYDYDDMYNDKLLLL